MPTPRVAPGLLALALLLPGLAAVLLAAGTATAAPVTAELVTVEGRYGPEGWKDESGTFGDATKGIPFPVTPPGYTGVYRNPYADSFRRHEGPGSSGLFLGMSLLATIALNGTDATGNYLVDAVLKTPWGDVPAKLTKRGATTFLAQIDLDGEVGKPWPNLLAPGRGGTWPLLVTVHQVSAGPLASEVPVGSFTFPVTTSPSYLSVPGLQYPQDRVPGYADLGAPANLTRVRTPALLPNETVNGTAFFGIPNAPARVIAWNGAVPFELFNGTTNETGSVAFSFEPAVAATSGLLVLEGHLLGDNATFAATHVVLPVSARAPRIVAMGFAPGPGPVDGRLFEVTVQDPEATAQAGSRRANLVLLAEGDLLGTAEFAPPGTDARFRTARVQSAVVTGRAGLDRYEAFGWLLDNNNRFYGLAHATRGFTLDVQPLTGLAGTSSTLRITLTNLADNGDARRGVDGDAGLALAVKGEITGITPTPLRYEATVPEAGTVTVDVAFVAGAGTYGAVVNATAAEFALQKRLPVLVDDAPGLVDSFFQRVPAPDLLVALAFLGLAALLTGARRRREP